MTRRNSSHVGGSEIALFVAWRMVVLKSSSGRNWRTQPNTVWIDGSALIKEGWRKCFVCGLENGCFKELQWLKVKKEAKYSVDWRISPYQRRLNMISDISHAPSIQGFTYYISCVPMSVEVGIVLRAYLLLFSTANPCIQKFEMTSFKTDRILRSTFSPPPTVTFLSFSTLLLGKYLNKDSHGPSTYTLQNWASALRIWPLSKLLSHHWTDLSMLRNKFLLLSNAEKVVQRIILCGIWTFSPPWVKKHSFFRRTLLQLHVLAVYILAW